MIHEMYLEHEVTQLSTVREQIWHRERAAKATDVGAKRFSEHFLTAVMAPRLHNGLDQRLNPPYISGLIRAGPLTAPA